MKIPLLFYGNSKEVKKALKPVIKLIKSGSTIIEAFEDPILELQWVNTEDYDCVIIIEQPIIEYPSKKCFHLYLLLQIIGDLKITRNKQKLDGWQDTLYLYEDLYNREWLSLLIISYESFGWYFRSQNAKKYAKRLLELWDKFNSLKLGFKSYEAMSVWRRSLLMSNVLCTMGLPVEVFRTPLPNNDLSSLFQRYNINLEEE